MPGPYASIHHLFHDHYAGGVKVSAWAQQLHQGARLMLERTAIVSNLQRAYLLLDVMESLQHSPQVGVSQESRVFGVFALLTDCYSYIADDLLVAAAFEIHAKAKLLKAGYVIHNIREPVHLRKLQKKQPIHVRTVRARMKQGDNVLFDRITLGIATLLEARYLSHYPLTPGALGALGEVRRRRNLVHFAEPHSWAVDRNLLELVEHLNRDIPPFRKRQRRRSTA